MGTDIQRKKEMRGRKGNEKKKKAAEITRAFQAPRKKLQSTQLLIGTRTEKKLLPTLIL